jgi:signal transduction histidine kinase
MASKKYLKAGREWNPVISYFGVMNNLGKFFLMMLLVAQLEGLFAQIKPQKQLDSLLTIARKVKPDSNSMNALIALQRYYFDRGLYDSTLTYAEKALQIAKALGNNKTLARMHYRLGMTYTNLSRYDSANYYLNEALTEALAFNDTVLQVNCYNAFAYLHNYQSDYSGAIEYLLKAVHIIDVSNAQPLKEFLPQTYSSIAYNFLSEKQYVKAIEYGKKALLIKGYPNENRYRVLLHLTVFDAYLNEHDLVTGKKYLDSAIVINQSLDNDVLSAMVANNEGNYHQTQHDFKQASTAYLKAYQLNKKIGNQLLQSQAAESVASLYYKMKNYTEAEKYAVEAIALGRSLKLYPVLASANEVLKSTASQKGDFKRALHHAEQSKIYADSALNEESHKITLSLESKYQHQKKEREIAALTIANSKKELEVVKRNRLLIMGGLIASATLIIVGLLYRTSRQKQLIAERDSELQQEQIKFLERQQQVVSLQSMINGQETERTRIAKDLHDGLGGLFSTVKMYFSTLQHDVPSLKENELFNKSYTIVDTASEEVRRIAHNMMPEVLMKLGLVNALKDLCDGISAGKLLSVSLEVHGMNQRLNIDTEIMLFRIIQELLNNIIKHAQATEAIIQFIREDNRLSVVVEDNGRGFNTQEAEEKKHAGIATVQSRVNYLNGKISIDSQKNIGTTVMMDFLINES